jgi:hypothetical protein
MNICTKFIWYCSLICIPQDSRELRRIIETTAKARYDFFFFGRSGALSFIKKKSKNYNLIDTRLNRISSDKGYKQDIFDDFGGKISHQNPRSHPPSPKASRGQQNTTKTKQPDSKRILKRTKTSPNHHH